MIQPDPPLPEAERSADRTAVALRDDVEGRPLQPWSDEARRRNRRILSPEERLRRGKVARFQDHLADIVLRGDDDLDNPVAVGFVQLVWWGAVTLAINAAFWLMSWFRWDESYVELAAWFLLLAAALIVRAFRRWWPSWLVLPAWMTPRMHDPATARLTTLRLRRDLSTIVSDRPPADVTVADAASCRASVGQRNDTPSANTP